MTNEETRNNNIEALSDEQMASVSGGVTSDELQTLEYGTRVHIIAGPWEGQYGTITGFCRDFPGFDSSPKILAWVTLDKDGKIDGFNPEYFEVV